MEGLDRDEEFSSGAVEQKLQQIAQEVWSWVTL